MCLPLYCYIFIALYFKVILIPLGPVGLKITSFDINLYSIKWVKLLLLAYKKLQIQAVLVEQNLG